MTKKTYDKNHTPFNNPVHINMLNSYFELVFFIFSHLEPNNFN